MVVGDIFIYQ